MITEKCLVILFYMHISYAFCKHVNMENLYYKEFLICGLCNYLRKSYWLPHCMLYAMAYTDG